MSAFIQILIEKLETIGIYFVWDPIPVINSYFAAIKDLISSFFA